MKKYLPVISVSLLFCLFIYIFYRTEKTLVNQLVIALFSREVYCAVRTGVRSVLPLQDCLVYSLPEGLWVFCITLTSSFFYLKVYQRKWHLVFVPVLVAWMMELLQRSHCTRGRFDWMDITFATGFWLLAVLLTRTNPGKEPLFQSMNSRNTGCIVSYAIVYLAHVSY